MLSPTSNGVAGSRGQSGSVSGQWAYHLREGPWGVLLRRAKDTGGSRVSRALVLNASFEPLCIVSTRRALLLVLDDRAEMVESTGAVFHSPSIEVDEPSVVRLVSYVKVPYRARVALNRRSVFARDDHRCQYCGATAENIDHVIPRSRGGAHSWDNVVAACRPCNARKEDRLLHETPMRLRRPPFTPTGRVWTLLSVGGLRPEWDQWISRGASRRRRRGAVAPASLTA